MKPWQFNALFVIGVGGAVFMLTAPYLGINGNPSPVAVSGIGAILTFVLTQRRDLVKRKPPPKTTDRDDAEVPDE